MGIPADDLSQSLILFGDRVGAGDLAVTEDHIPLTLAAGNGLELVLVAANLADITVTGLCTERERHMRLRLRNPLAPGQSEATRTGPDRRARDLGL